MNLSGKQDRGTPLSEILSGLRLCVPWLSKLRSFVRLLSPVTEMDMMLR